jgi:transcriptional regulator with XRE-family HTH domain
MISSEIKKLLKEKDITIEDLANAVGVSRSGLQLLFKTDDFKVSLIQKIADYLGVHIGYFFGNDESLHKTLVSLQIENKELQEKAKQSIPIYDLEDFKSELKKHVKNGEGLVNFVYDIIDNKFFGFYQKLESSPKNETKNHM